MILEFGFNNYKMFKNDTSFSFKADKRTKYLLSNSEEIDNVATLKALALYGANNSGKTKIIDFFKLVKQVLLGEDKIQFNSELFDDPSETSCYIIYNNLDGLGWIKYEWTHDFRKNIFVKEKLSTVTFYTNGAPFENIIFEKSIYDKKLSINKEDKASLLLPILPNNKPFLHTINVDTGEYSILREWKESLITCSNSIEIISMYNIPIQKTIDALKSGDETKAKVINSFVKAADLSIDGFEYRNEIGDYGYSIDEKALREYSQSLDAYRLTTICGNKKFPSLFYDSTGTKKIEAVASYIYEAIFEGKTLILDELDNGLHFTLTRSIVSVFNNMINKKGQIFFTAHDLLLIDCNNLLRKDQIYFLSRNNDSSSVKSLKEVTANGGGLREGDSLLKRYNHGDFGPVPLPNFIKEFIMLQQDDLKEE